MRRTSLILAVLLAVPAALVPAAAASATSGSTTGVDVSYPQCSDDGVFTPPASDPDFAVVAVNHGLGLTDNRCLQPQAEWAAGLPGTTRPAFELYVNTQKPSPSAASWWPGSNSTKAHERVTNPYGTCAKHRDDTACAYVYGASIASDDLSRITAAGLTVGAQRVWLDVEQSNSWSVTHLDRNRAVLEGMAAWFAKHRVRTGLYSTHKQWTAIAGTVSKRSALAGLPSWLSAATTLAGAAQNCTHAPLTPRSRVVLAQVASSDPAVLDTDLVCAKLAADPRPAVHGTARVGHRLTVSPGAWSPSGVRFSYAWLRDGRSIAGATGAAYVLRRADRRAEIAVRVTGVLPGFSRGVRESRSLTVR